MLLVALGCSGSGDAVRQDPPPEVCQALAPAEAVAEDSPHRPVLIEHAHIWTAAGTMFEDGYIYFENGRIAAVGEGSMVAPSAEVWVIDAGGRYVTPGIIDTHSHLGVYASPFVDALSDGNEATSPTTPQVAAVHSIWPQDPGFQRAIAGGVTALQVLPGSANLIGGRGVTLKLHRGARSADEMRFPGAPDGLKMACGENPKRVYGDRGSNHPRMGRRHDAGAFNDAHLSGTVGDYEKACWLMREAAEVRARRAGRG
jgi:imidazolonepropionase-like amidohydrolase